MNDGNTDSGRDSKSKEEMNPNLATEFVSWDTGRAFCELVLSQPSSHYPGCFPGWLGEDPI